jgi:hypothetical protein
LPGANPLQSRPGLFLQPFSLPLDENFILYNASDDWQEFITSHPAEQTVIMVMRVRSLSQRMPSWTKSASMSLTSPIRLTAAAG